MGAWSLLLFLRLAVPDPGAVQGKVVPDFDECSWFFQDKIPPQGFATQNRVKICQRYNNRYHYATLYRTDLRIPVYSAYKYPCSIGVHKGRRPKPWFYEPQIDNQNASAEMMSSEWVFSVNQAVDADYLNSNYDRGHLYPFSLNRMDSATATCTLTNAVPQVHSANVNWAKEAESIAQKLAQICHKSGRSMYLVTGADYPTDIKLHNRVSVPGLAWTALCCTLPRDQNNDHCLNDDVGSEEEDVPTYSKDFSFAFMKMMKPEQIAVQLTVRALQKEMGMGKIFNICRGTSADDEEETFEEVKRLIKDNSSRN